MSFKKIYLLFIILSQAIHVSAQEVILEDDFSNAEKFVDLSQKLFWGGQTEIVSGFTLSNIEDNTGASNSAVSISAEALQHPGYKPGTLQASLAFDYSFSRTIHRKDSLITIEFDAFWDEFNNPQGEAGRMVFTLLHDYPKDEIAFNAIYDVDETAPFGRPTYNLRIRNTDETGSNSAAFMLYGGGHDLNGEIEIYKDDDHSYWLPGFTSEAGGTSPGSQEPYPKGPTLKNARVPVASLGIWRHYTWVILPDKLEFYMRESGEEPEKDQLIFFMETPLNEITDQEKITQLNAAHNSNISELPILYHYFESFEALRIYFRGITQAHLSNLKISTASILPPETIITGLQVQELKSETQIFPNPNTGRFFIKVPQHGNLLSLTLINNVGQRIYEKSMANYSSEEIVLPSNLKGCYFANFQFENSMESKMIIVE